MKHLFLICISVLVFSSCSNKRDLVYLNDFNTKIFDIVDKSNSINYFESGDILKIDVKTIVPEAAIPYNFISENQVPSQSIDIIRLGGYVVDEFLMIKFPVLGEINVKKVSLYELEKIITNLLIEGGHLTNPSVKIRRVNSKFTILGEVRNPGTFDYFDKKLNIFQALGYAGDLTINGKRNEILLIREQNGIRSVNKITLTDSNLLETPYYQIKNNDVIIIEPNFSKIKSAGFIGSPSSIASISSLLLSITLLIINK